jgi:DNA repair exonuclease SbcCD nuclease subunit
MHPFRFIHASDFHLETPVHGLAEAPQPLREILLEATYRAANNVFDAALRHEVDFVVLSGDLVAPQSAGPRAMVFLRDQFARLAEQGTHVYWAGGAVDRVATWPQVLSWPSNVHFFPDDHVGRCVHRRHELALCELIGQSQPSNGSHRFNEFTSSDSSRFAIAVAHGEIDQVDLAAGGIGYWALGGEHEPTLPVETAPLAHYPGTPQGRSPQESGPHGCTLVSVDLDGRIRPSPLVTDVVRFAREKVRVQPQVTASEIERMVRARLGSLVAGAENITWLVGVDIEYSEAPAWQRDNRGWPLATLATLRGEFGYRNPAVWVTDFEFAPPQVPPKWRKQDNLLGDYLHAIEKAGTKDTPPLTLDRFLPAGDEHVELLRLLTSDEAGHRRALAEAAQLGASLLAPEETSI